MQGTKSIKKITTRLLVALLSVALVFTMMPLSGFGRTYAASGSLETHQVALVVTGTGMLGAAEYTAANVAGEKSYSLDELKAMNTGETAYSAKKQRSPFTESWHKVRGVSLGALVPDLDTREDMVALIASDGYVTAFQKGGLYRNEPENVSGIGSIGKSMDYSKLSTIDAAVGFDQTRYCYDSFESATASGTPVEPVIAWNYAESGDAIPESAGTSDGNLKFFLGQLGGEGYDGPQDMNGALFNGGSSAAVNQVLVGDHISEVALTIGSKSYTRAEVLQMDFAENAYTYDTEGGSANDYVRGIPMSVLLDGYNDNDVVTFEAADGYGVAVSGYTVKQLIDNDYLLAYEKGTSAADLTGIYETAKKDTTKFGFFRLYGSDANGKPAKLVNKITVTAASGIDFSNSPYKHITNGGQEGSSPYNIDAITGATLTVEGPGVKQSVPVSVRDLEGRNAGAARADYTDKREGSDIERTYEGIDLQYILTKMSSGDNGIQLTENAKKVQIKNRNRRMIAEFTLEQVAEASDAGKPILVAYGTSYTNGTSISPFVFDNGTGADPDLGNEDGCIKLVYDKNSITGDTNADYKTFGNMAYIYVTEGDPPGYKHDKDPYQSPDISNYVLTVTGEKIGREVNYTVKQLEDMVAYDGDGKPDNNSMGYRDEYSLANSTYWYVNEYEGVQLWKLLLKSGLDPALASDDETIVGSTATDGYAATDKFTIKQVADPNSFGFYEKNPLDMNDGTYEGNENIRQGNDVNSGDKLSVGYPVLVAYGVNGYPYVEKSSQAGYLSGLQNDGGPLRVISGKLKYTHANGSNQAKLLDKILVGDDSIHYSTHKYHNNDVYTTLADNELRIKVLNGSEADAPVLKDDTYKVGDIEELIYGGKLSKNQLAQAKIKAFYGMTKNGNVYSDLYEGVNLQYFLTDIVEIPGYKGTITFSNGAESLALNLGDVLTASGSNADTGVTGLKPILAYGKNGAPMVATKNAADGYEDKVTLAEGTDYENEITIKNNGGPLQLTFPTVEGNTDMSEKSITGINSITINLSPDKYAHTKAPYDTYMDNVVTIKGEGTRLGDEGKDFKVSELEGKQTLAFTGDYSILKDGASEATQTRYRGINLYSLLSSTAVGLKSNADKVIVTTTDNESTEFTLSEIRSKYKNTVTGDTDLPVILAYGTGKAGDADKEDGKPLVTDKTSEGYDADYGNAGGPIRLAVGQTEAGDVNSGKNIKYVKSIEVTASEMTSWNHNSADIFKQYRNETVQLVVKDKDDNELYNKTYTVGEIEDNDSLVERINANVVQDFTWEGINFWRWVKQEAGSISGINDPISVTVAAADGFSADLRAKFGVDGLEKGILDGGNYTPIILAYGVGGYPLVIGDKSHANTEGYDATAGNNGGPLRLVTHNSQGTSLTYVTKVTVVVGEGGTEPEVPADFTIKGLDSGDVKMSIEDIQALPDNRGKAEAEFTSKKNGTEKVKGAYLKYLLANKGVEVEATKITLNTTDEFEKKEDTYNNITLKQAIDQNYFVAYQVWDADKTAWVDIADSDDKDNPAAGKIAKIRIYREYNEAQGLAPDTDWRNRCTNISGITLDVPEIVKFKEYATSGGVRSTWMDKANTLWVGTYGGGLYSKKAGEKNFTVMNTGSDPALLTDFTSAVAVDKYGGVWVSQNASYTDPGNNQGVLYIKDGEITQYKEGSDPATIPNNYVQAIKVDKDGKVWFGSFGGLTIYDPAAGTWTTYDKAGKGFPATSINTITLDGKGGAWLGFYPDGAGTAEDPYSGGFCHIDANGNVSNITTTVGEMTTDNSTSKLAQAWVRNIDIDPNGGVWVVASGTNLTENEGGTLWYLPKGASEPEKYTGDQLVGEYLDGSATTELRVVAFDADGAMWLGTSADGVLKVDDPAITDGKLKVTAQYAKETGSWSAANRNNVYSINFWNDGTAYVGSAAGLQVLGFEPGSVEEYAAAAEEKINAAEDANDAAATAATAAKKAMKTPGTKAVTAAQKAQTAAKKAASAAAAAVAAAEDALAAAERDVANATTQEEQDAAAAALTAAQTALDNAKAAKTKADKAVAAANTMVKKAKAQANYKKAVTTAKAKKVYGFKARANKGKKVTVRWKVTKKVSGYQIKVCKNKKFKKGVKTVTIKKAKTKKKVIRKLRAGKTYYVKMRTFTKIKNPNTGKYVKVYGKWTKAKRFKAKK